MTRKGNIVTVVPTMEAMDADPKLRTRSGPVDFGDAVLTRVFRLRHVDTASAEALLTQMKLGVAFSSIAETKTLIVTAFTATMPKIEALLDLVDQPGEPKQFRYRPLKYTMATTLTEKVKALAEQMGTIQVSVSTTGAQPALRQNPGESEAAFRQRQAREMAMRAATARAQTVPGAQATPETIYLDADERTNRILMVGRQEQLAIVDRLVESLDVQQQDLRSLLLYRIEHVDAQDVRKKLEELNIVAAQYTYPTSSTRITGAQRTATPTTPGQPTPQPLVQTAEPTAGSNTALDAPQVVVVEATNALLINATAEQHKRIGEILKYVDSETLDSAMPFEIYPLENQGPDRMAEIIDKLIQERLKDKDGKIEQVVRKIEDEITIVPDPNTYSLVVHATPKNQQWIGKLIKTLDKRRPQVLIDVTLVEVSKTEDFNYDLNLITAAPNLSKASGLIGTGGVVPGALLTGNVIQAASGNLTGFYGDDHINVLLKTMQTKKYGRVLAKPKILVNDNETGTIKTTDTTYVKTTGSAIPTIVGGTSSGAITTSEVYTPYDAGITMDIIPHISEGDLLQLKVNLTRSDFTSSPQNNQPPNKSQSDISTMVTVPDKSTIILGGMIKLNQSKGGTKVPILGDLPIVGAAFRSTGNSDIEKKLYVFVKAEIIRPADVMAGNDALQKLSEKHRMAFERHEAEFQQEQSIPGVKAKSMSPDKVLDTQ
jgi:type II secretory pathway component GspD/PulD (secretin)